MVVPADACAHRRKVVPNRHILHLQCSVRMQVYNVTPYLKFHPGGVDYLMLGAGKDATALFNKYHWWVNIDMMMNSCLVGLLAPRRPAAEQATQQAAQTNGETPQT